MVQWCTSKIPSKVTCLVDQIEHHNLPFGIIINRCLTTTWARAVLVILINTTKQNIWLQSLLLAAELFTAEYHQIEHRVNKERREDNIDISFLPVALDTIRAQSEQVEVTSSNLSSQTSTNNPTFGPRPNTQPVDSDF